MFYIPIAFVNNRYGEKNDGDTFLKTKLKHKSLEMELLVSFLHPILSPLWQRRNDNIVPILYYSV